MHDIISGTVISFDYGEKRIGVACGETLSGSTRPLEIVEVRQNKPDWPAINSIVEAWEPEAFILGAPGNDSKSEHPLTSRIRRFGNQLEGRYNIPVLSVDERLSSVAAKSRADSAAGEPVDAIAAQLILETWLDEYSRLPRNELE